MKILTIRLKVSDVIYDIRNKAWLTARARDNGTNFKQVAFLKPDNEGGDLSQLMRSVIGAWRKLLALFAEYIPADEDVPDEDFVADADADTRLEYLEQTLWMPNNFNEGLRATIADTAHKYVVARALGEWLRLNVSADADKFLAEAEALYGEIWTSLGARVRPERPGTKTANS